MIFYLTLLNLYALYSNQRVKKLYIPTFLIGQEALKYISESKYLGFSFSDSKCDDCDMLRQNEISVVCMLSLIS